MNNKINYYQKRDNELYTKYTKREIWDMIDPRDTTTLFPFLQDMNYPYIEEQWNKYVQRYGPKDGRIIGRYIALMRLKGYQPYTWADSIILNQYRANEKRMRKMYKIIDKRGSGKTSRLMLLAKEHNGILVCSNPYAMREKAHSYGLTGFDIVSYRELQNPDFNIDCKPVFIDEIDGFLYYLGHSIQGYTLSLED